MSIRRMIPALMAGLSLLALGTAGASRAAELRFEEIPAPQDDTAKRQIRASREAIIDNRKFAIDFHTILRSGSVRKGTFGMLVDRDGKAVKTARGTPAISNSADFSSLLKVGGKLYMITHFENRPGGMYLTELKQDPKTGELAAIATRPLDFSEYGGLWVPCAGSVTPWNTHLGSEEYPPDAHAVEKAKSIKDIKDYYRPMARYFGLDPERMDLAAFRKVFHPYRYGYPVEIAVDEAGKARISKHFAMGRTALELAYVMPDRKTVYMSSDGTNEGFYMFVADKPGDLSAGRLYAAKWNQTSAENGGAATLEWIDLGHADDATIRKAVEGGIRFSDLFETAEMKDDGSCPEGFGSINKKPKCLKLRPGMEMLASRLETTRYAALKGATTEFRKEEGITYDPDRNRLYVAMSAVARGMEDNAKKGKPNDKYDKGGPNHIRLSYNPCGTIYALELHADKGIGSDFVATGMKALLSGRPVKYGADSPWHKKNKCDIDGIANPDNITYIPGYDTLIIGEDTGSGHQNDAVWAYNLKSGKLTRIQTTPYGSETTSVYFHPDINGFAYLMSVVQHPYGESDQDKLRDPADARAYVGYIGPFPAMKK